MFWKRVPLCIKKNSINSRKSTGPSIDIQTIPKEKVREIRLRLNRPIVLSEFGGFGRIIKNHVGCERHFSYINFETEKELTKGIKNVLKYEIYPNIENGLCASVYTQLSDIEEEVNGFLTYDRKILKVNRNIIKEANNLLKLD